MAKLQKTPSEIRAAKESRAYWKKHGRKSGKQKKVKRFKKPAKLPYETRQQLVKMSYPDFLQSKYWKLVRQLVLTRDGNACVICKKPFDLHIHHDTYIHHFNELNHLGDLITLCADCHKEHHYAQA